jgi:hypothetical protein
MEVREGIREKKEDKEWESRWSRMKWREEEEWEREDESF